MTLDTRPRRRPGYWLVAWDEDLYERLANSGGPMSRRRTERLSATVLGHDDGAIRCPRVLRVGLDFGGRNPLTWVRDLLTSCGFSDEHEARAAHRPAARAVPLPPGPCGAADADRDAGRGRRAVPGAGAGTLHTVALRPAAGRCSGRARA